MAADASSTLARGKILLKAQEVTFAKALAGNNLVLRDRAVRRLKKWFDARSKGKFCFEEDDLMRVWKGLYHCMWMSDKPLVQEALSEEIASLVHSFATPEQLTLFVRCFYLTMINEWVGIDQLRLDKYLMLIRRVLRQSLVALRRLEWDPSVLELYNTATGSTLLTPLELVPIGLVNHYCSIFLEELAKIGGPELEGPVVSMLLPPMVALWAESRSTEVRKTVMRSVLDPLIAQSPITLREDARFRAWAKAGFPGTSMYSMELVEDPDEEADGEEPVGEIASAERGESFDGLDPRAGSADVVLQPIKFDAGLVAGIFDKHLAGKVGKVHVSISRQQLKFARLAKGLDPITRRHRVRDLRALPFVRKEEKWRCARQWQSAVELAEFDPAEWKASKKRKNKFQGETDDEIFADFVSKHATEKKKRGASGKFTVVNGDLANGNVTNGEASEEVDYVGHAKKPKFSGGEWTVTTENGVEDGGSSQETQHNTPASKLGKRKALQMENKQSTPGDSKMKQTSQKSSKQQMTPVESAEKTPLVESAKKTPLVESAKKTPIAESVKKTPMVESTKKIPVVESVKKTPLLEKKQTPLLESKRKTLIVESVKKTPMVESSKISPVVESVKKTPLFEKKQTPLVESKKKTLIVESVKKTPMVESTEKTPVVESEEKMPVLEKKKIPLVESTKKAPMLEKKQTPLVESGQSQSSCSKIVAESDVPVTTPARSPDVGRRKLFSASANQLLMSSPPAPGEEPWSPAVSRKRPSMEGTLGRAGAAPASVGLKVRNSFGAVAESLKKTPLATPQYVASPVIALGKKKKEHNVPSPQPAASPCQKPTETTTATASEVPESKSKASPGRRLSLNVVSGPAEVREEVPAAAPAVAPVVTRSKRQSVVPGSPSRTSLRIAQKAPLGKTKTTTPQRAVPNAVEVLRTARASLGSPAGTKRVNIALGRNEAQEVWEYHAALESSPGIPYDAARRPAESALKPGAVPSPVNPFYRRPKFLS